MEIRFGIWNVRSLYRAGSLKTVVTELAKYKLDLVAVQEVRWDDLLEEQTVILTITWWLQKLWRLPVSK
jgi:hypothetical protein